MLDLRELRHEMAAEIGKRPPVPLRKRTMSPQNTSALVGNYSGGSQTFKGALPGRINGGWPSTIVSADQTLQYSIRRLRGRSRYLAANSSMASSFLHMVRQNIVGEHGVKMVPRPPKLRGDGIDEKLAQKLRDAWQDFCEAENFSVDGQMSKLQVENLIADTWATDGEVFIRLRYDRSFKYGIAVEVIDADQVDDSRWEMAARVGVNSIRMGIEVNQYRRPVAYYCYQEHPSEYAGNARDIDRVPAEQVLHVRLVRRPKQTRGYSWFAPVMQDGNQLEEYIEAVIVASRVAACQMAVITQEGGEAYEGEGDNSDGTVRLNVEAGTVGVLPPGADLKPFTPTQPTVTFGDFTRQVLHHVSAGLGVSYHKLASDMSGVNYSSARTGELSERDLWKMLQKILVQQFHRPLFKAWLPMALATQLHDMPADFERLSVQDWVPRRWDWVDPLKDVQASVIMLQNGFTTREEILAERGKDFLDVVEKLVREKDILDEAGLQLGTDMRGDELSEVNSAEDGATGDPGDANQPANANGKAQKKPMKPKL